MEMDTNDLAQGFWHLKQPRDESRQDCINESGTVFGFIGFTNKSEFGVFVPDILSEINEEWVGIVCCLGGPVATLLFGVDDMPFKDFLMSVDKPSILYSAKLLLVDFVNLWTDMPIIKMDSVDLVFLNQLHQLIEHQVPRLLFSVV